MSTEEVFSDGYVQDLIESFLRKNHLKEIDSLKPTSSFHFPITDPQIQDLFIKRGEIFHKLSENAVFNILKEKFGQDVLVIYQHIKLILVTDRVTPLSAISPEMVNSPVCFDAMVIGIDKRLLYVRDAHLTCSKHGGTMRTVLPDAKLTAIKCGEKINAGESCDRPLYFDSSQSKYDYVQNIVLQEHENKKIIKKHLIDCVGKLRDENVGSCMIGQTKRIIGLYRPVLDLKTNEHDIIIDVISVEDLQEESEAFPNDSELDIIKADTENGVIFEKLVDSFAPGIFAFKESVVTDVKKAIILHLAGGVSDENDRGEIHVFLVGDASVAKSTLLKFANSITQRSIYTTGIGTSKAGLTIAMVKRADGTSIPEAGVLPLCHGSFAQIDELDKMFNHDRAGLIEAMEERTVSAYKAGIKSRLPAATAVLSAANPKLGDWNDNLTIMQNIQLPIPLLTRFDLIFKMVDKANAVTDRAIASHIVKDNPDKYSGPYSRDFMLKFFNFIRKRKPVMSEDAEKILVEFYTKIRSLPKDDQDKLIVPRQLNGIKRIAKAYAKIFDHEIVTVEDAEKAIEIFKASLTSRGYDLEAGTSSQDTFPDKKQKNQIDTFWECFNKCTDIDQTIAEDELIESLAQSQQFDLESASRYFVKMTEGRSQQLLRLANGRYRRI